VFFVSPLARNPKWRWWASGRHRKQPRDETLTNNNSNHHTLRGHMRVGTSTQQWLRMSLLTKSHKGNIMWRRNANKANPSGKKPPKRTVITPQSTTSIWTWLLTYRWPLFLHDRSNGTATSRRLIHRWWFVSILLFAVVERLIVVEFPVVSFALTDLFSVARCESRK
jgi:hypothetical protein